LNVDFKGSSNRSLRHAIKTHNSMKTQLNVV